jgi:CheY-like chemotaxis protein
VLPATRILIVEDERMLAIDLEDIVNGLMEAEVVIVPSVSEAREALSGEIAFAFLDVNVTGGTTFSLASELLDQSIPFAFVSSSRQKDLPLHLRVVPFSAKPCDREDVKRALAPLMAGLA